MFNLYICFTTIRSYEAARTLLIASMPPAWRSRCIITYQGEPVEEIRQTASGPIEVSIRNNIYEYGNYIGAHLAREAGLLPADAWCLFIHDTCRFGPNTELAVASFLKKFHRTTYEIIWLSPTGQCNLCFIRGGAIRAGWELYAGHMTMSKADAIRGEWEPAFGLSPKTLAVPQYFFKLKAPLREVREVYGPGAVPRGVFYFLPADLEKYAVLTQMIAAHPNRL